MNDAVAVTLELRAPLGRRFLEMPSARGIAELRERREDLAFDLFQLGARAGHKIKPHQRRTRRRRGDRC